MNYYVIRCKDCKYSYESVAGRFCSYGVCVDCMVSDNFFCAYGVLKDEQITVVVAERGAGKKRSKNC